MSRSVLNAPKVSPLPAATHTRPSTSSAPELPFLLTADEAASLLRTTRASIYAMAARRQIGGVTKVGRRLLFRSAELLEWLDQKRAPSPQE